MSSTEEALYLLEISKQLTEMEETIDKMGDAAKTFTLLAGLVGHLDDDVDHIQDVFYRCTKELREIRKRERIGMPLPTDSMTKRSCDNEILDAIRTYQKELLPNYQKMVEQLLDKKDDIKNEVAEKRQAGEKVPSDEETKNALDEAGKKLQQAIKEKPEVQKSFSSISSFIEKAKPYVEPLVAAAKIALKLLAI